MDNKDMMASTTYLEPFPYMLHRYIGKVQDTKYMVQIYYCYIFPVSIPGATPLPTHPRTAHTRPRSWCYCGKKSARLQEYMSCSTDGWNEDGGRNQFTSAVSEELKILV